MPAGTICRSNLSLGLYPILRNLVNAVSLVLKLQLKKGIAKLSIKH